MKLTRVKWLRGSFRKASASRHARIVPFYSRRKPYKDRSILRATTCCSSMLSSAGSMHRVHARIVPNYVCEVPCKERCMMRRAGTTQLSLASLPRSVTNHVRSKGYELRAHHFCVGSHSTNWVEVGAHVISMVHVHWSDLHANGRAPSAMVYQPLRKTTERQYDCMPRRRNCITNAKNNTER